MEIVTTKSKVSSSLYNTNLATSLDTFSYGIGNERLILQYAADVKKDVVNHQGFDRVCLQHNNLPYSITAGAEHYPATKVTQDTLTFAIDYVPRIIGSHQEEQTVAKRELEKFLSTLALSNNCSTVSEDFSSITTKGTPLKVTWNHPSVTSLEVQVGDERMASDSMKGLNDLSPDMRRLQLRVEGTITDTLTFHCFHRMFQGIIDGVVEAGCVTSKRNGSAVSAVKKAYKLNVLKNWLKLGFLKS